MVLSQLTLGIIITTTELYPAIPLLVTFDLYLGHRVSICAEYQFQYLRNCGFHQDETWYGHNSTSTICHVYQFCLANLQSGEIIDVH